MKFLVKKAFDQLLYSCIKMTDPFKTNPYIFSARKPDLAKTQNFLNKVTSDAGVMDTRETGATSFKDIFSDTKKSSRVRIEIEDLDTPKLTADIRPGHKSAQKNTLWSKA